MIVDKDLIMKAKEQLGDQNAELIADILDLGSLKYDTKNKKSCCPYHEEKTPSFVYNPKEYNFHCFGCGKTVDVVDAIIYKDKCSFIEALQKLFELAEIPYSFGEHKVKTRSQYKYPTPVEKRERVNVEKYLGIRKISPQTMDIADIREDENGNIVFNYYDLNDVLTMVKYRPSRKVQKGENKCWCQKGADTSHLLFNMHNVNTTKPLLVCEGEIDCLSAIEAGYPNAVSVPLGAGNTHWIEENWEWLEQFDNIIICADNDEAGIKLQKEATYRLGSWRTKFVEVPRLYETPEKKIRTKDLNEVLYYFGKEKVLEIIANAKDTPVDSVIDIADIKDIDLSNIDGICTGIDGLDKELMRLFYGSLTLVTGTPGAGKTSFLYQLICQALEQDKNCWLFSKELPAYMTKNWFTYIMAGSRHISEYQTTNGTIYYKVHDNVKKLIDEEYRSHLFIYKDDYDNSFETIKVSMEDTARKYGAKLFILDNLMTINMGANSENKYEKQTELVNWLINFSMKFNVAVILVCHPRKLLDIKVIDKYDISGSSNLINLAHRTLSLRRVTDKDKAGTPNTRNGGWITPPIKADVVVTVLKDRMRGREGYEENMLYDRQSRRFYTNLNEYAYQYRWDKNIYDTPLELPYREDFEEVLGVINEQ